MTTVIFGVGYVGSRLIQELLFQGREIVALDSFFASDRRAVDGFRQSNSFRFVEGSIVDPSAVDRVLREADEIESVYLLAAQASARPDAASPDVTEEVNLRGPRIILDALASRTCAAPIVFASSTRVYGAPLPDVVDETSPYGVFTDLSHLSKCYAEKLLEMYARVHRLTCRVVRLGLVYGVAPVMKTDPRFMTAPNLFCYQAATGAPIEVKSLDPLALIQVDDAMRALALAAEATPNRRFQVFNAATAVRSISEVAELIRQIGESRDLAVTVRDLARRTGSAAAMPEVRSALGPLGFVPRRELEESLAETLDHFLVRGQ
ncbi:MAG: NAD-dependent epimerase/dehydratase family protein [Chloroflexota bacterium]